MKGADVPGPTMKCSDLDEDDEIDREGGTADLLGSTSGLSRRAPLSPSSICLLFDGNKSIDLLEKSL